MRHEKVRASADPALLPTDTLYCWRLVREPLPREKKTPRRCVGLGESGRNCKIQRISSPLSPRPSGGGLGPMGPPTREAPSGTNRGDHGREKIRGWRRPRPVENWRRTQTGAVAGQGTGRFNAWMGRSTGSVEDGNGEAGRRRGHRRTIWRRPGVWRGVTAPPSGDNIPGTALIVGGPRRV